MPRLLLYLTVFVSLIGLVGNGSLAGETERPNIVFIFSDDHAPQAIGAYGGWLASVDPTPNIDKLASQGMLFQNSFCTNSICGPSRAVILTGKHSHKNGFMKNGDRFDANQQTFPKLLQKQGYQTAIIGKWHLGSLPTGFDHWQVLPGQGDYYNPEFITKNGKVQLHGHCTQIVTNLAIQWMEEARSNDKPFVLMCQHKAPHRTWMPAPEHLNLYQDQDLPVPSTLFDRWEDNASPAAKQEMSITKDLHPWTDLFFGPKTAYPFEDASKAKDGSGVKNLEKMTPTQRATWDAAYKEENEAFISKSPVDAERDAWKYQRYMKNYLRCVRGVDDSVGQIMSYLEQQGLDKNTIVIYSSDQGFYLGEHGWYDKRWMYEESFRMPLIVKWPGVTEPGSVCKELVQNLDYAETFVEVAGGTVPDDMQGHSLVPLLSGEKEVAWRPSVYYHYFASTDVHKVARHNGVRTKQHKLIHFVETNEWELYNLNKDPDELTNIYTENKDSKLVTDLKKELERLEELYDDKTLDGVL